MFSLKRLSVFFLLTVAAPFILLAQDDPLSTIVGTVGGENITYGELLSNYSANAYQNESGEVTIDELRRFLPIYLDYRAKILAGKELGFHKDSALVAEYETYTRQAAYSYWLEKEVKPSAFEEFKQRSELELKAFHILIALDQNATEAEVNEAITKLEQAKSELEDGVEPAEVDRKYSTVQNGRSMGGDIPWISAGRTVKEFEDQVYALEPGEVSEPFRTQFGYHIVLLQNKREHTPSRLVRHIFVAGNNDSTSHQKIKEAYQQLEEGTEWNQVENAYSEDRSSTQNAGLIGWINYQAGSNRFIDIVMKVDTEVAFTRPKETNFGYHIFRIDSVESYPSEEARDEALRAQLEQTPYYESNAQFVLDHLNEKFTQNVSDDNIVELTKKHYPDFEQQAESFLHGLIVFKLNEEQLWNPATIDSTRLKSVYHENPERYRYPERAFYYLLSARHDSTLDKAIEFALNGSNIDSLSSTIGGLRVTSDSTSSTLSPPFDRLKEMDTDTFSNKFDYNNSRGVFWLEDLLAARQMTFDEAYSLILNEMRPKIEQEWMEKLRGKYNVVPNFSQLQEAYRKDS